MESYIHLRLSGIIATSFPTHSLSGQGLMMYLESQLAVVLTKSEGSRITEDGDSFCLPSISPSIHFLLQTDPDLLALATQARSEAFLSFF